MSKKIKHLELVQSVISRMANNSFMLKGWAVTLVAGIFVLAGKDTEKTYFLIAYIPVIVFWGLDSYYLLQERLYRLMYDKVREMEEDDIDFALRTTKNGINNKNINYFSCFFSITELCFYFPLALVCTGVNILNCL